MAKSKSEYVCQECGAVSAKWSGKCQSCSAWNTLLEQEKIKPVATASAGNRFQGMTVGSGKVENLSDVSSANYQRVHTGLNEFDRVLGGGLVNGSVVMIGGDPGIGKSTLLLQTIAHLSKDHKVLYISGEESLQQIKSRGERLKLDITKIRSQSEIELEKILNVLSEEKPKYVIIDSIQTLFSSMLTAAPGSISQVKDCATKLNRYAKEYDTTLIIVCHVTKEGDFAGPRALEHIVDTVLFFEGDSNNDFRMLRAIKNRFGPVNELGIFAMTEEGLEEVNDPANVFVNGLKKEAGATIFVSYEGNRAILVECQALLSETPLPNPIRRSIGIDLNRLQMFCALLHKYAPKMQIYTQNVFLSLIGGLKLSEPGIDVPAILAMMSSFTGNSLPAGMASFGELGLTGEIKNVRNATERIQEAIRLGVKEIVTPPLTIKNKDVLMKKIKIIEVHNISELYQKIFQ